MTAAKSSKSSTKAQKDSSKTPTHPPYSSMVTQAVSALKGTHPKGVSRQAIAKYLQENFTLPVRGYLLSDVFKLGSRLTHPFSPDTAGNLQDPAQ